MTIGEKPWAKGCLVKIIANYDDRGILPLNLNGCLSFNKSERYTVIANGRMMGLKDSGLSASRRVRAARFAGALKWLIESVRYLPTLAMLASVRLPIAEG
jgi:hypothetical protein